MRDEILVALAIAGGPSCAGETATQTAESSRNETIEFEQTKLLIEHNATDRDTGFQGFVDGEPWSNLEVRGPDGDRVLSIAARGSLEDTGLTELFFETDEPPNDEVPIDDVLARLPEGDYQFRGRGVEGEQLTGTATLSHRIPEGPRIVQPAPDVVVSSDVDLAVEWLPVTRTLDGRAADITHYELIVEVADQVPGPGFGGEKLDIHVPASTTQLRVPCEFLRPHTEYSFEVLALDASGNQTLSSGEFATR